MAKHIDDMNYEELKRLCTEVMMDSIIQGRKLADGVSLVCQYSTMWSAAQEKKKADLRLPKAAQLEVKS